MVAVFSKFCVDKLPSYKVTQQPEMKRKKKSKLFSSCPLLLNSKASGRIKLSQSHFSVDYHSKLPLAHSTNDTAAAQKKKKNVRMSKQRNTFRP